MAFLSDGAGGKPERQTCQGLARLEAAARFSAANPAEAAGLPHRPRWVSRGRCARGRGAPGPVVLELPHHDLGARCPIDSGYRPPRATAQRLDRPGTAIPRAVQQELAEPRSRDTRLLDRPLPDASGAGFPAASAPGLA